LEEVVKQLNLVQALNYAMERKIVRAVDLFEMEAVVFNDGTVIKSRSSWSGPYSEVTPDIDANAPEFLLYDSEQEAGV
jgi:hypothetical protein